MRIPCISMRLPILVAAICLCVGAASAQAPAAVMPEDPFAPKNTVPFDIHIDYDLAKSPVKTIYVVPSAHWDREFTDPDDIERDQLAAHVENLIDTMLANPDFRWHDEATWHIEAWLRSNPCPQRQEQLFSLVREGKISIGASHFMGIAMPDEVAGRIAYTGADLAERYNIKLETADAADFIGFSWAQVQPLARSGVKYLLHSHHISFPPPDGISRKNQPFWWHAPDGSRLMVWRIEYTSALYPYCIDPSGARFFSAREIGPDAAKLDDMALTEVAIKHQLRKMDQEGYTRDAIMVVHSHDCVKPSVWVRIMDHVKKWNATHDTPKLQLAIPEDFFRHMEEKYGNELPIVRGEYRDLMRGAAYRNVTGRVAAADLVEAEKMWALADITGAGNTYPAMMIAQGINDIIETAAHGGGAWWASQLQTDYTRLRGQLLQQMLASRAHYLRRMGLSSFAQKIYTEKQSFAVVNTLSWERSGVVELPVTETAFPIGSGLKDTVTGKIIPVEWEAASAPDNGERLPGPMFDRKWFLGELGYGKIRFFAEAIPPMGYKIFEVVKDGHALFEPQSEVLTTTKTIENPYYRLTLSPAGQIMALYDKKYRREMVSPETNVPFIALSSRSFRGMRGSTPDFNAVDLGNKGQAILRQGPVASIIEIQHADGMLSRTIITLASACPEIRIRHYFSPEQPGGERDGRSRWRMQTLTLPLNYKNAELQSRIQLGETVRDQETNDSAATLRDPNSPGQAVATTAKGTMAAGAIGWGAYFSDRTHGTFIASREITEVSAPPNTESGEYATIRLIARSGEALFGESPTCEFVISTDDGTTDSAEIYRRSLSGTTPLRPVPAKTGGLFAWEKQEDFLQGPTASFLASDNPNVIITALKRARGGQPNEYALRLVEIGGKKAAQSTITLPPGVKAAYAADQTERKRDALPLIEGTVTVQMNPNQLQTLRLEF